MEKKYYPKMKKNRGRQYFSFLGSLLLLFFSFSHVNAQLTYCSVTNSGGSGSMMANTVFGSINYNSTTPGASNYTYVTTQTTVAILGSIENLSVTVDNAGTYPGAIISVWFDWNQDGVLSASEWTQVAVNAVAGTTVTIPITIPTSATPGLTRMRLRSRGSSNPNGSGDACSTMGSGETIDFDITVAAGTPCSGTPTAGTIAPSVPDSICPNVGFALVTTGTTIGTGMSYQWQSATAAAGPWTDITGATNLSYSVSTGISTPTYYRLKSSCSGGTAVYSNEKQIGVKSYLNCFCFPTYSSGCAFNDDIRDVTLVGNSYTLANMNTPCPAGGYMDYTTSTTLSIPDLTPGLSYNGTVTTNYTGVYENVKIWIDYNNDGTFDDVNELATSFGPISNTSTGAYTINVPVTAIPGLHRMRVMLVYSTTNFLPCSSNSYGEAHDYLVDIQALLPCTNPPTAGTLSGVDSICANNPFILNATGTSTGSGLVYQWQSAPSSTGPWTDITGANLLNLSFPTGITAATSYRLKIVCSGGTPVYTSVKTVTLKTYINCYCASVTQYGCQYDTRIENFSTTGASANISNLNSGCANTTTGYSDYTAMYVSAMQGTTFDFSTSLGQYEGGIKIWIDWNHDGFFDPVTELVASTPSTIQTGIPFTGTVSVPATAATGPARMRVKAIEFSTIFDPCSTEYYGETEDYTINVLPSIPCTNPPIAGGITGVDTICPSVSFTLQDTGASIGGGLVYQWQSSATATGPWTNIVGANTLSYVSPGITTPTYFRLEAICNTGTPVYTAAKLVQLYSYINCYCIPVYNTGCAVGDDISNVTLNGVTTNINNSTGCSPNAYGDYTNLPPADLNPGDTFSLKVSTSYGSPSSEYATAWIDYNQNGVFDASEAIFNTPNGLQSGGTSQDFVVPSNQAGGLYRLRVRLAYYPNNSPIDPCASEYYGETEDYMVQIGPPCPLTPVALGADTTICDNAPLTLDAGSQPAGATYTWSTGASTQTINVNTSGTYSVLVSDGTCSKADTITVTVNPSPIVNLGGDTVLCNGGPYIANAGNVANYSYLWTPGGETSNSKTISTTGAYSVKVTNSFGCSTSDTINVTIGELPSVNGITTTGASPTFNFSPNNPLNVTDYLWDFGDGTTSTLQNPSHTYTLGASTAYSVSLTVSNDCGEQMVLTVVSVTGNSIKDLNLNSDILKLYPNPTQQTVTIENQSNFKMRNIVITNVLGQQVMKLAVKDNKQVINVAHLVSGLYQVTIEFDEGTVNRKLEVIK